MERTKHAVIVASLVLLFTGAAGGPQCSAGEASHDAAGRARRILADSGIGGGLAVQIGCRDAGLAAALGAGPAYLVHGLDTDADTVAAAREQLRSLGVYGRVSVDRFDGRRLPYAENLVNLIVADDAADVPDAEIMRVLVPRGVAYVQAAEGWRKIVKPWPEDIDEWTHFLHGPGNNAVAQDRVVGPPSRLQWIADPIHLRSHEHLNSVSALVSAGGRVFYIIDQGPTASVVAPPKWRLVARDAFNGILLWEREIGPWEGHFRLFRSGPPAIARRLVSAGDRVYVTLGYGKPAAALDAATGETVRTYDATEGALEIVCDEGTLFVVVGEIDMTPPADPAKRYYPPPAPRRKGIVAVDAASGDVLWQLRNDDTAAIMPTTLAAAGGKVFFQNTREIVCLDAASGKEAWRADRPVYARRLSWSAPTLVAQGGVVLSADGSTGGLQGDVPKGGAEVDWVLSDTDIREHPEGDVVAFSAEDGRRLWTGRSLQGFCNPGDLFVIDGKVWCGADVSPKQALLDVAVDLKTGEVVSRRPGGAMPVGGHTRCYRNKATEKFLIMGDVGVEFVDVEDWSWNASPWVRGTCQYGVMPSNGLLYVPPDSCACRPESRLHGFTAMAPEPPARAPDVAPSEQLEPGPAYAEAQTSALPTPNSLLPTATDWPTYRHDAARSGRTETPVPTSLESMWRTKIGRKLTSLTVAAGKVFVADVDSHTVYALDAKSGRVAWSRTVGGPVDSPPTIFTFVVPPSGGETNRGTSPVAGHVVPPEGGTTNSLCLFGCRDGRVYCLRAGDGELVWRFRAAPQDRFLIAMERLESAWPVSGSVLVHDGKVWFASGRSPYLDGGIRLYALDATSGKAVVEETIFARGPQEFHTTPPAGRDGTPPSLPDILSASDGTIYMRWMGFDDDGQIAAVKPHLFSATGFLDDTWWHRTYWQYGTWMRGGFGGWPQAARQAHSGRIMVVGDDALFSFGRTKYDSGNGGDVHAGHIGLVKQDYQDMGLVAPGRNSFRLYAAAKPDPAAGRRAKPTEQVRWQTTVPMLVRAMLLADQTLFLAGPEAGDENRGLADLQTEQPGRLWAVSAADGRPLARHELAAAPLLDGMAAADGRLYLSAVDGTVVCLGKPDQVR